MFRAEWMVCVLDVPVAYQHLTESQSKNDRGQPSSWKRSVGDALFRISFPPHTAITPHSRVPERLYCAKDIGRV